MAGRSPTTHPPTHHTHHPTVYVHVAAQASGARSNRGFDASSLAAGLSGLKKADKPSSRPVNSSVTRPDSSQFSFWCLLEQVRAVRVLTLPIVCV